MDYVKILGAYGTKSVHEGTTCIQVSEKVLIDAGNIINPLKDDAKKIEHIFLTHSHIDHIVDLPFLIDLYYADQKHTLQIYALKETIDTLKKHIFNFDIYPDFSQINLQDSECKALEFNCIEYGKSYNIDDISLMPVETNHTVKSCGYVITKNSKSILFTSDTYINDNIWNILNTNKNILTLISEVSFPSYMSDLAHASKHYTPKIFHEELKKLKRNDISIYLMHLKPNYIEQMVEEINYYSLLKNDGAVLHEGYIITFSKEKLKQKRDLSEDEIFNQLVQTGIALSANDHQDILEEKILKSAMKLTRADAGTLYLIDEKREKLCFKLIINDTMSMKMGGDNGDIDWKPLYLYDKNGDFNLSSVATACALKEKLINISDVYKTKSYNFTNTKMYDSNSGYRSKSMLVAPMLDHEHNIIGVLQLINKKNILNQTVAFNSQDEVIIRSLASQAAVSINNQKLISDLENLLENFLHTINMALDEKSPYTSGHIGRMVDLSVMLAESINSDNNYYASKHYNSDEIREIRISALMHDIGKIVTPEHIMDKRTKLESIFDRIVLIRIKSVILKRDLKIEMLEKFIEDGYISDVYQKEYDKKIKSIDEDIEFLTKANQGDEFFSDESLKRVEEISKQTMDINGVQVNFLNSDEVENLCVRKGTLTKQQRDEINNHASITLKMLNSLSFPQKLKRVPEIASAHHEKINGKGYPLGIKDDEISFEARILAIADIFEALTASDRPYKKAKKLSEAMEILFLMAKDGDIDFEICSYFYESGLYKEYAKKYLAPENIDSFSVT